MATSSDLSAFGLRASPFTKEIDDADLWLPESKAALVADIEESLAERHSILLLGEPGVGKTCVLRALRRNLPQAGCERDLFPDDALAALHELSQGALREIDRLANTALRDAAHRKKKLVDRELVLRAGEALVRFD